MTDFADKYKDAEGSCEDFYRLKYTDDEIIKWRHDTMKSAMYDWLMYTRKDFQTIKKLNSLIEQSDSRFKKEHKALLNEIDELKNEIGILKADKSELESDNSKLKAENKRYARILNCRPVKTTIKLRNAFMSDKKKIKL